MSQVLFVTLSLAVFCLSTPTLAYVTVLESPNVTDFGDWSTFQNCSKGKHVTAFQLKVEPGHSLDDTALNGIRFFCGSSPNDNHTVWENVTSRRGVFGYWAIIYNCTTYAVGFELQSQPYQGFWYDDTAANNLKIHCADGEVFEGYNDNGVTHVNSTYTEKQECPKGYAICGIQTQVEPYQDFGDDTSLNRIRVKCCDINNPVDDPQTTTSIYIDPDYNVVSLEAESKVKEEN